MSRKKQLTEISVFDDKGNVRDVITEPKEVMLHTYTYWKTMFEIRQLRKAPEPWFDTNTHNEVRKQIEKETHKLTQEIPLEEIKETLRTFRKKKAPGSNNIPN